MVVRHRQKQGRVFLFGSPFSLCRKKGWPSRYSKTVALAKPTVSRSKRKSDPAALCRRRTRTTKAPSCQKPAAVRELLGITSRTRRIVFTATACRRIGKRERIRR